MKSESTRYEAARVVAVGEVAGAGSSRSARPAHAAWPRDRAPADHGVALAPHDQRRHLLGEVEPVGRGHVLPAGSTMPRRVRMKACRASSRSARRTRAASPRCRRPRACRAGSGSRRRRRSLRHALRRERAAGRVPSRAAPRRAAAGTPRGRGRRSRPARGARCGRETGRRTGRHAAAERVADDRRVRVAERADQVANTARVGAERVVAARLRRVAVAEQVRRHHRVVLGERLDHVLPRLPAARDPVDQDDTGPSPPGGSARGVREM